MLKKYNQFITEKVNETIEPKELETILNPNFSIVVPGGCNGKCDFCFWTKSETAKNYIEKLTETIELLPTQFYQLSLTGGEPTISPMFKQILETIDNEIFEQVILTTNATNILEHIDIISEKVNHINISRHHWDDKINESIFGTNTIPNTEKLKQICEILNQRGIDVTMSVVLTEHFKTKADTDKYIDYAKECGASAVFFRKIHGPELDKTDLEKEYNHKYLENSNCPVCRTDKQLIKGIPVSWKASLEEPSNELGYLYEAIFNENGTLTSDWKMQNVIEPEMIVEHADWDEEEDINENLLVENCGTPIHGCGGSSDDDNDTEQSGCGGSISPGCGGSTPKKKKKKQEYGCGGSIGGCGSSQPEETEAEKKKRKRKLLKKKLKRITKKPKKK